MSYNEFDHRENGFCHSRLLADDVNRLENSGTRTNGAECRRRFFLTIQTCSTRIPCAIAAVMASWLVVGCRDKDTIQRNVVPKPHIVYQQNHVERPGTDSVPPSTPTGEPTDRMLAAIAIQSPKAWFFKVVGPIGAVGGISDSFHAYVESIRFDEAGEPRWTLPEGWRQQPGSEMRFATITIDTPERTLDLSVIALPMRGNLTEYIVSNINRWRRDQLSLPPIAPDELDQFSTRSESDGAPLFLVDFKGHFQSSGMSSAPFAQSSRRPRRPAALQKPTLSVTPPGDWKPGPLTVSRSGITIRYEAAYVITDGTQRADVTVSYFPAAMASALANVNRWRSQVSLPPIGQGDLDEQSTDIVVGGLQARLVQLNGTSSTDGQLTTTLAAIATDGGHAWIFKMMGNTELVKNEKSSFETFLRSAQFGRPE